MLWNPIKVVIFVDIRKVTDRCRCFNTFGGAGRKTLNHKMMKRTLEDKVINMISDKFTLLKDLDVDSARNPSIMLFICSSTWDKHIPSKNKPKKKMKEEIWINSNLPTTNQNQGKPYNSSNLKMSLTKKKVGKTNSRF